MTESKEFSKQKEELYKERDRLLSEAKNDYQGKVRFQSKVVITMLNELLADIDKGKIEENSESFTAFYVLSAFVDYISEFMRETLILMENKDKERFSNFINRKTNEKP